jgi:hypothetical protein
MDSSGSAQGLEVGSYEGIAGSIKRRKWFDQLSAYELLKEVLPQPCLN